MALRGSEVGFFCICQQRGEATFPTLPSPHHFHVDWIPGVGVSNIREAASAG